MWDYGEVGSEVGSCGYGTGDYGVRGIMGMVHYGIIGRL